MSLRQTLLNDTNRPQLIQDCVTLVHDEVAAKPGLGGVAIKGGLAVVTRLQPNFVSNAIETLLSDFTEQLEPFYASFRESPTVPFSTHLLNHSEAVAHALLEITDRKAANADARLKKAYHKLRPTGVKHVRAAVPGIGRILEKYLPPREAS
ncbi:MAG: hypothetical protein VX699_13335 [Myxococcota bacterium]|nr:hypothetical protein [Myxococcota bacterium]